MDFTMIIPASEFKDFQLKVVSLAPIKVTVIGHEDEVLEAVVMVVSSLLRDSSVLLRACSVLVLRIFLCGSVRLCPAPSEYARAVSGRSRSRWCWW